MISGTAGARGTSIKETENGAQNEILKDSKEKEEGQG